MIKNYLREKHQISNYQIAQIEFLFKTIFSEFSKIMIIGLLFHNQLEAYLFALCIMLFMRCSTGGLHFYTYFLKGLFILSSGKYHLIQLPVRYGCLSMAGNCAVTKFGTVILSTVPCFIDQHANLLFCGTCSIQIPPRTIAPPF